MVYRRSRVNVRKPARRRSQARRKSTYSRPRSSRRSRTTKKTTCVCPTELSPSARFALAQLDPFHGLALGAKIPDTTTIPSIANSDTDQVSAPLATTGFLTGFAFRPYYNAAVIPATPASASAVTWPIASGASNRRNLANVIATFEAIRPVAHAVRLVSPLAPTSATGFVHIGLSIESLYNSTGATFQYPTTVNEMMGLSHYKRVTLASLTQSPLTVINKWIDEHAFQYEDPNQALSMTASPPNEVNTPFGWSWAAIVVLIEGAPSTPSPLAAEHILLTEGIPRKDVLIIGTQAAINSPGTMAAVSSMVGNGEFSHTEAGQESYVQQGLESLARGAQVAGEQVFNGVAVPLLQRIGQGIATTAANMALNAISGRGGIPGVNSNPNRLMLT